MSYTKDDYKLEIKEWEKKHGYVSYLNPAPMPKWMRGDNEIKD